MLSIIKKISPWWLKILSKIILSRFPLSYNFWSKINIFRHGQMDNSNYAFHVFSRHVQQDETSIKGKTILEIGPGDSLSSGIIAFHYGAKSILINPIKLIFDPIKNFNNLKIFLQKKGFKIYESPKDLTELCNKHNIQYFFEGLKSLKSIPSDSVDIIFSNAVLEHIFKEEFEETIKELKRVLKRDGFMSHQIDFKDHLEGSLNNLRFSESLWESYLFRNSGFYTNRIRFNKMINIFKNQGLEIQILDLKKWDSLPLSIKKISKQFIEEDQEGLFVSSAKIKLLLNEK
tara:strand:+ start:10557 stop:11420 length:864 start_codon:yes stop_codon:yes gene_type:complete